MALGKLVQDNAVVLATFALVAASSLVFLFLTKRKKRPAALNPEANVRLTLAEKMEISHDTRRFRFSLPSPEHILGLPVGQHLSFSFTDSEGKLTMRQYTPTTSDDEVGYVDFVIKVYFKDTHPKFPAGGKMTQHLESLKIGDTIDVRGPKGKLTYLGRSRFSIKERPNDAAGRILNNIRHVGMIAGGSGITPMLQIINAVYKDKADRTELSLLFANQSEKDILLRETLDSVAANNGLRLWYTIDRTVEPDWRFSVGFINKDMLAERLPPPGPHTLILVCGPPAMWQFAVQPNLEALGYDPQMIHLF
jgi:cytochrome-b5 reductase